ncbi:MAG: RHS repeat-associated core domain-containing protein [candidate division Zixibacteria bacterium]|nr:RHS repeat-associated core domain-containing protein [candidate division Zixibacteria bacterium]
MRDASGKLHYYLSDHLGSTRVVIDSTGLLEDRYWYHSFGTLVSEQTSTNQAYRYTSKPLDKEGGLDIYYYGARYYDPELGRFLALDPAAGEYPSLSPYAYCANNPLGLVDTDGNNFLDVIQGAIRAFADNLSLGLADKRSDYTPENPSHYSLGQDLGDVASVAVGGLESLSGAEAVVVGVAGTAGSGGTAAAVGVPVAGAGVVVAGHGAGMAAGGLANLFSRGGRLGGQDHRSAVKDEAARLEGEGHKIDAGGGGSEKRVNTPSGKKEHRFPDIQSRDPSGNVVYTNVGRTAKNGSPVPRENEALQDLQRTGQTTRFVPMEE